MTQRRDVARNWRVLHACETAASIAAVADAQSQVGMSPQLLSREYWCPQTHPTLSLLNTWHDVRDWRHVLNEAEVLTSVQIVHAHSFASAMAGVRGSFPLVYDFAAPLEDGSDQQSPSGPWLLRSFRVAEQFAISRASAVVVHSDTMRDVAREHGAVSGNVFVIPEPFTVPESLPQLLKDPLWTFSRAINPEDIILYALPDPSGPECILRAFAMLTAEVENVILLLESDQWEREPAMELARELHITEALRFVDPVERDVAMGSSRLVIAPATGNTFGCANTALLRAMAGACTLVAADVPENRECSKEGRGLAWFRSGDPQDLSHRVAFVARNVEFSRSLGTSSRAHIEATRSPRIIGLQYDEVYRHAYSRRSNEIPKIHVPKLYALGSQFI